MTLDDAARRPQLASTDLVCLTEAQVLALHCEHGWIRFPRCRLGTCSATCRTGPATTTG